MRGTNLGPAYCVAHTVVFLPDHAMLQIRCRSRRRFNERPSGLEQGTDVIKMRSILNCNFDPIISRRALSFGWLRFKQNAFQNACVRFGTAPRWKLCRRWLAYFWFVGRISCASLIERRTVRFRIHFQKVFTSSKVDPKRIQFRIGSTKCAHWKPTKEKINPSGRDFQSLWCKGVRTICDSCLVNFETWISLCQFTAWKLKTNSRYPEKTAESRNQSFALIDESMLRWRSSARTPRTFYPLKRSRSDAGLTTKARRPFKQRNISGEL